MRSLLAFLDSREIERLAGGRELHHHPESVVLVVRQRTTVPIDLVDPLGDNLTASAFDRLVELARLDVDRSARLNLRLHRGNALRHLDPQCHGR
jgi:hypothetical protein